MICPIVELSSNLEIDHSQTRRQTLEFELNSTIGQIIATPLHWIDFDNLFSISFYISVQQCVQLPLNCFKWLFQEYITRYTLMLLVVTNML